VGKKSPLNLTELLASIAGDICYRLPEFAHIDVRRVLFAATTTRSKALGGVYAKIAAMRFADGTPIKVTHGAHYSLPQIPTPHGDILYIVYVYVPRFFEQSFERRVLTLIHELYHISPKFDGSIRKVGRGAHGASRESFNDALEPLVQRYLQAQPPAEMLMILRTDFPTLVRNYSLLARRFPLPKAIRL